MTKGEQTEALFREGCNCCQSVAGAFCDEIGLPRESVLRLASGFGGGFGRLREVCGAFSGATLVAGMLRGYSDPAADAEKTATYAMIQRMAEQFKEQNGSLICRELLCLTQAEGTPQAEGRSEAYYQKRPCAQICRVAAEILAEELARDAAGSV
ncbi:MAG: C-GCAxxG-C-C family protein [Ruthenibacterium sp.]